MSSYPSPESNSGGTADQQSAVIHFDGGARPNPGQGAIGVVIQTDHWEIKRNDTVGGTTNNRAEYLALLRGLELALARGCTAVEAKGDSKLVVEQVSGNWDVNDPELKTLHDRVQAHAEQFDEFELAHIDRERNAEADALASKALPK
jgi:ribonuclease HI